MKTYFCLDTCTWIYLANGTEPAQFLQKMQELSEKGEMNIILPQIVLEEWNRNKDRGTIHRDIRNIFTGIHKHLNELSAILCKMKKSRHFIVDKNEVDVKKEFEEIGKRIIVNNNILFEKINDNISIIENIFSHPSTKKLKTSTQNLLDAGEIALTKKAPIHRKNGFADAVILLTFIEYVKSKNLKNTYFITYNTVDFCQKEMGKNVLHSDLKPFFEQSDSRFRTKLGFALRDVDDKFVEDETLRRLEEEDRGDCYEYYCWECGGDEYSMNGVFFGFPKEIVNENNQYDSKTLSLFTEEEIAPAIKPQLVHTIQVGHCNYCSSEYIKCQQCGEIILIESYSDRNIFVCDCGIKYKRNIEQDRKGAEYATWCIIDDKTMICEKCGEVFIDEEDLRACPKCGEICEA